MIKINLTCDQFINAESETGHKSRYSETVSYQNVTFKYIHILIEMWDPIQWT